MGGVAFDGTRVIVVDADRGDVQALDPASGLTIWKTRIGEGTIARIQLVSATLVLIAGNDGVLYAIETATGVVRWRADIGIATSGPIRLKDTHHVLVLTGGGTIRLYDMDQGKLVLERPIDPPLLLRPLQTSNGNLVIALKGGGLAALDPGSLSMAWTHRSKNETGVPVEARGVLVSGSTPGTLSGLAMASGDLLWQVPTEGAVRTAITAGSDGLVAIGTNAGHLRIVNARDGASMWECRTSAPFASPPVFMSDGSIVAGDYSGLVFGLDRATGKLKWNMQIEGEGPFAAGVHAPILPLRNSRFLIVTYGGNASVIQVLRDR